MICSNCGRGHENSRGRCPFCSDKTVTIKKQREKPQEAIGGIFNCTKCGDEIVFVPTTGRVIDDIPVHKASGEAHCPKP